MKRLVYHFNTNNTRFFDDFVFLKWLANLFIVICKLKFRKVYHWCFGGWNYWQIIKLTNHFFIQYTNEKLNQFPSTYKITINRSTIISTPKTLIKKLTQTILIYKSSSMNYQSLQTIKHQKGLHKPGGARAPGAGGGGGATEGGGGGA